MPTDPNAYRVHPDASPGYGRLHQEYRDRLDRQAESRRSRVINVRARRIDLGEDAPAKAGTAEGGDARAGAGARPFRPLESQPAFEEEADGPYAYRLGAAGEESAVSLRPTPLPRGSLIDLEV